MSFSLSSDLWDDEEPLQIGSPLKLKSSFKIQQPAPKVVEKPAEKPLFSLSTSLDIDIDDSDGNISPPKQRATPPQNPVHTNPSKTLKVSFNEKKRKADQIVSNNISPIRKPPQGSLILNNNTGSITKKPKLTPGSAPRSSPPFKIPENNTNSNKHSNTKKKEKEDLSVLLPKEKITLWQNLIKSFAPELAQTLTKDLISPTTINLRNLPKQYNYSKPETELIASYKNDYPFSGALAHALSILIGRSYDQIRSRWFDENRFANSATVDGSIVKLLSTLEQFLRDEDTMEEGLGPLAKELLNKIKSGQSLKVEDINLQSVTDELNHYEHKRNQNVAINVDVAMELLSTENCSVDKGILRSKIPTPRIERRDKPNTKLTTISNGAAVNRFVWEDIAKGTLRYPLKCINDVDDEKPPAVEFVNECVPSHDDLTASNALEFTPGCLCQEECNPKTCSCAKEMHEQRFPYNEKGLLVNWPTGMPIYECNSNCQCGPHCRNRVLQKGVTVVMEVYKTKNRGWGVRTTESVPRGKFVCEYTGEHVTNEEAEQRGSFYDKLQCSYLLDLDVEGKQTNSYTIDATYYGTVSRYFNHNCDPNLVIYPVWVDDLDPRKPRIGLYAKRDISAGEELTFDYKYETEPRKGQKKNHIVCRCGAKNCRGILY